MRAAAARVIDAVMVDGSSLKAELARQLPQIADRRDRALLEAICYEVLRHYRRYSALSDALLQKPLPRRSRPAASLVLVGLAQLDGLELAPHAALSASVDAVRELGQPQLAALVNAVLRRYQRERETLNASVQFEATVHLDHPDWLRDQIRADWPQQADAILHANNQQAPMWLRLRQPVDGSDLRPGYLQQLEPQQHDAAMPDWPSSAICLAQRQAPDTLPGWADGVVAIQDGAAQIAASLLDPQPGSRVLDACAAPGGKLAHLLDYQPAIGELIGLDCDPARLPRIRENLQRLRLHAELVVADASTPDSWWDGRAFDRILIDAPCSGTGVIRRHPDIKWHRRSADIAVLAEQQARLLDALWPLLGDGGRLVYATCSVLKDENSRQIDAFLDRHPDAIALDCGLPVGQASGNGWQILPGEGGMDGFFYACLARR